MTGDDERSGALAQTVAALGALVLQREAPGRFRILGEVPRWARALGIEESTSRAALDVADFSPFLENFLTDAESFWNTRGSGRVHSGVWSEAGAEGESWNFDAQAMSLSSGESILVVQQLDRSFEELLGLLQQARGASLDHHQLRREIDKKEVLLHCIVHDLKGPLSGMMGGYSLLGSCQLEPDRLAELVDLGLRHARRQNEMIENILDVFAAELAAIESVESGPRSPSLRAVASGLLRDHHASFSESAVDVELEIEAEESDEMRVVGAVRRLERVLMNLLENAIRHSPRQGQVLLGLRALPERVRVEVADRGPGVAPELRDTLFERFVGGGGGSAGLGLYFCRLVVRQWGGTIGYEPREGGGACFWFELPRATAP